MFALSVDASVVSISRFIEQVDASVVSVSRFIEQESRAWFFSLILSKVRELHGMVFLSYLCVNSQKISRKFMVFLSYFCVNSQKIHTFA